MAGTKTQFDRYCVQHHTSESPERIEIPEIQLGMNEGDEFLSVG